MIDTFDDPTAILTQEARWLDDQADAVERIGVEWSEVYELTRGAAAKLRARATVLRLIVLASKGGHYVSR